MEPLLSPRDLAKMLGLAEQTIYNRRNTGGDLPQHIKLGRLIRFRICDVEAWLEQQQALLQPALVIKPSRPRGPGRPTKAEQIASRLIH